MYTFSYSVNEIKSNLGIFPHWVNPLLLEIASLHASQKPNTHLILKNCALWVYHFEVHCNTFLYTRATSTEHVVKQTENSIYPYSAWWQKAKVRFHHLFHIQFNFNPTLLSAALNSILFPNRKWKIYLSGKKK